MIPFLHRLHKPPQQEDHPLWLIVLADMMTNLMLFFLVMFALAQQGPAAQQAAAQLFAAKDVVAPPPKAPEPPPPAFVETSAAEQLKALFADTTVDERAIRVRLQNRVLFPSAYATLSLEADDPLARLARVLKEMPNTVVVEGHTDAVRVSNTPYKSNWELSVARSYAVIERLIREGVPPERLVASGYGERRPVASNDTAEGRALNRRVEIVILRGEERR